MQSTQTRRRLLATLSSATAAALISSGRVEGQDAPPETTTVRLTKIPGICIAPQYVAEELLRSEGFTSVEYVELSTNPYPEFASGRIDISMAFVAPFLIQIDAGMPLVLLGGVHAGCFELFGTERVNAIRDLKGKTVAVPELGSPHHVFVAAMASYVGIDPKRDINFVIQPVGDSIQLLAEGKVDALMGFPPSAQKCVAFKIARSARLAATGCVLTNSRCAATMQQKYWDQGRSSPLLTITCPIFFSRNSCGQRA